MARFGQGVMPQLGATDYTPFMQGAIRGSESVARGIEMLGQAAAQGVQQYYQKQEEKQLLSDTTGRVKQILTSNPAFAKSLGIADVNDEKALKAAIKGIGGGDIRRGATVTNQLLMQLAGEEQQRVREMEQNKKLADVAATAQVNPAVVEAIRQFGARGGETIATAIQRGSPESLSPTTAMRDADAVIESEIVAGFYPRDPKLIAKRRAELIGAGGREPAERYDNAGTYVLRKDQTGAVTAVKNRKTGQIGVVDPQGEFKPLDPDTYMPMTTGDANAFLNEEAFKKLADQLVEQEVGVKAVNRFLANTENLSTGIQRGIDSFSRKAKTILGLGEESLTESEKALGLAKAQQQRLLGALRTTILGPGVLTEIDAQRILDAVGGDVEAITTNKDFVQDLVGEILSEKMLAYEQNLNVYNTQVAGRYGRAGFKQREKIEPFKPKQSNVVRVSY